MVNKEQTPAPIDPQKLKQDQIAELKKLSARILAIQVDRRLSDTQLVKDYPHIGSTKTWRNRILEQRWDEINLITQLQNLRSVSDILDGRLPGEFFDAEMPFATQMTKLLNRLERSTNDRRILVCLAPNGTGKSVFARWAVAQKNGTRSVVRMRPTWRNKKVHICAGIARAIGKPVTTTNPADVEHALIEALIAEPRTVFIDQAHEGGVELMHELRSFVDETPSRFVYLAYPTAYSRVQTGSTDAMIEAQAFIGRCLKPPFDNYRHGILVEDVRRYLVKVGSLTPLQAESTAARVLPTLRSTTNLRLLDDAITDASSIEIEEKNEGKSKADLIVDQVSKQSGVGLLPPPKDTRSEDPAEEP